jgi:cytochrome c oxidase assembly protein subunit 15
MEKWILFCAKAALVLSLMVVLAGSTVRMTGSGMGCPDWPKCFGYYIPPTNVSQVEWTQGRSYKKGQIIVHNEALWLAKENHVAGDSYKAELWEKYTRHDYAIFNPMHTWIEYINRLIGALTGVPVLIGFFLSLTLIRRKPFTTFLATLLLFLLGFVAWLGKVVVDGNLIPHQITLHMMGAVAIILTAILFVQSIERKGNTQLGKIKFIIALATALSIVQLVLGTNVREEVDILLKLGVNRADVIDQLPVMFKVHRSFSLLVLITNLWIVYKWKAANNGRLNQKMRLWMAILLLVIASGVGMAYLDFPAILQPIHLLFAFVFIALQFSTTLHAFKK